MTLPSTARELEHTVVALRHELELLAGAWQDGHHERFRRTVAEPMLAHADRMAATVAECDQSTRQLLAQLSLLSGGIR